MADIKLVRRHIKTGKIEARKRGRPHPDYENGYMVGDDFKAGNPPKRRGRKLGRPKGSGKKLRRPAGAGRGLPEIEQIVRREVEARLMAAKSDAIAAFDRALGV